MAALLTLATPLIMVLARGLALTLMAASALIVTLAIMLCTGVG